MKRLNFIYSLILVLSTNLSFSSQSFEGDIKLPPSRVTVLLKSIQTGVLSFDYPVEETLTKKGGRVLKYIGVYHVDEAFPLDTDPKNPTYHTIKKAFEYFKPDTVILEGYSQKSIDESTSPQDIFESHSHGENSYTLFLA